MASYDSADLLLQFNQRAGRPTADSITDAQKYQRLARAQNRVVAQIASVAPNSLYPKVATVSMPTLTTTDNQIFTFGTDTAGYPNFPMGHGGIYPSLEAIPDAPWTEGRDYMREGNQIRIPSNGTYAGTLYWYGIAQPTDISASVEPAVIPEAARELIVIEAVRSFSQEWLRNAALADEMNNEWDRQWPIWCLVYKTQFKNGGALSVLTGFQVAALGGTSQWST